MQEMTHIEDQVALQNRSSWGLGRMPILVMVGICWVFVTVFFLSKEIEVVHAIWVSFVVVSPLLLYFLVSGNRVIRAFRASTMGIEITGMIQKHVGTDKKDVSLHVPWTDIVSLEAIETDGQVANRVELKVTKAGIFGKSLMIIDTRTFREAMTFVDKALMLKT